MGDGSNPEPRTTSTTGIHTTPRPRTSFQVSSPGDRPNPNPDPNDSLLYPRWLTLLSRTLLAAYEIAVLVITLRFLAKWNGALSNFGNPFHAQRYSIAVGTLAVALVVDPPAAIASAVNCYGTYRVWGWAIVFDVVAGIMGCLTPLFIAWWDHNGNSTEELGWFWEEEGSLIGLLVLGVG
jgi:hypothetical protein